MTWKILTMSTLLVYETLSNLCILRDGNIIGILVHGDSSFCLSYKKILPYKHDHLTMKAFLTQHSIDALRRFAHLDATRTDVNGGGE